MKKSAEERTQRPSENRKLRKNPFTHGVLASEGGRGGLDNVRVGLGSGVRALPRRTPPRAAGHHHHHRAARHHHGLPPALAPRPAHHALGQVHLAHQGVGGRGVRALDFHRSVAVPFGVRE